jgi:catechol 2,3-dioxygenase-like lactoylglutathione lyase family enzyme
VDHIGFAHPDVGGLVRRAGEHGVRPTDYFDSEGFRRAYFVDPNGHELEFVERLSAPGQAPRGADR